MTLGSCLPRNEYPNRPDIEYISHSLIPNPTSPDSIGTVTFRFTDGDGDLGLNASDTFGLHANGEAYHYNLFIHHYQKQNGEYVEFIPLDAPFHVRFVNLTPKGADKTLEGEMETRIGAFLNSPYDTVQYEIFIVDRAHNHSDTIVLDFIY